jgi:hypothetical protein
MFKIIYGNGLHWKLVNSFRIEKPFGHYVDCEDVSGICLVVGFKKFPSLK